jgi:hypothetical protein
MDEVIERTHVDDWVTLFVERELGLWITRVKAEHRGYRISQLVLFVPCVHLFAQKGLCGKIVKILYLV